MVMMMAMVIVRVAVDGWLLVVALFMKTKITMLITFMMTHSESFAIMLE